MYRPIDKKLRKKSKLPSVRKLWSVEEKLGGWDHAQSKFFSANVSVCSPLYQYSRQAASSNFTQCMPLCIPLMVCRVLQMGAWSTNDITRQGEEY